MDRYWSKDGRHRLFRWAATFAVLIAGFLAYDDLNTKSRNQHRADQIALSKAVGERDEVRRQLRDFEKRQNPPKTSRLSSRRYWQPLSLDETLRLRAEMRNISRQYLGKSDAVFDYGSFKVSRHQIGVVCDDQYCADLAGSVIGAIEDLGITVGVSALIKGADNGIYIRPDNKTTRDIATAIERATNGRLLVEVKKWTSKDNQDVTIVVGRKSE